METTKTREPLAKSLVLQYSCYGLLTTLAMAPLQFLNFFNTNVMMINPVTLGNILLVARLIDFVITFMIGGIIENSRFKSGKYLPWLSIGPRFLIYMGVVFTFMPFEVPLLARSAVIIIAYLCSNTLLSFIMTCQYGVLAFLSGPSLDDRNRLVIGGYRMMTFANVVSFATTPLVRNFLVDKLKPANGYFTMGLIYGAIYLFAIGIIANLAKPFDGPQILANSPPRPKISVKDMVSAVLANNQLIIYLISSILNFIGMMSPAGLVIYYYTYIQNDPGLLKYAVAGVISQGFSLVASLIGPKIGMKLGRKMARVAGTGTACLSSLLVVFFGHLHIAIYISISCFTALAMSFYSGFSSSYIIDVGNYGYWKSGVDNRTVTNSLINIPMKISTFIGGSLGLYGLSFIGYTPNMEVSTQFIRNFMLLMGGLPAVCYLLASIMTLTLYKIDDKEAELYVRENLERDRKKAAEAAV